MKSDFRKKVFNSLKNISDADLRNKSLDLSQNLLTLLKRKSLSHEVIAVFCPIQKEPLWYLAFEDNDNFALPALIDEQMKFVKAKFEDLTQKKSWLNREEEIVVPDIYIIPGVAFSKKMERLGRGKGFFDKFLENKNCIKIGVCFDIQLFEQVPSDDLDINMDYIVTDKTILKGKI